MSFRLLIKASDLKWVEASAREVAEYAIGHTIIVEKSTLPVRTAEAIKSILEQNKCDKKKENQTFEVLSNPLIVFISCFIFFDFSKYSSAFS